MAKGKKKAGKETSKEMPAPRETLLGIPKQAFAEVFSIGLQSPALSETPQSKTKEKEVAKENDATDTSEYESVEVHCSRMTTVKDLHETVAPLLKSGQFEEALSILKVGQQAFPDDLDIRNSLALLEKRTNSHMDLSFQEAYDLGTSSYLDNSLEEALTYFRHCADLDPENQSIKRDIKILEDLLFE